MSTLITLKKRTKKSVGVELGEWKEGRKESKTLKESDQGRCGEGEGQTEGASSREGDVQETQKVQKEGSARRGRQDIQPSISIFGTPLWNSKQAGEVATPGPGFLPEGGDQPQIPGLWLAG